MKTKLTILGCGSSVGVPRIDGVWGNCDKSFKKNYRTRCSAIITKGSNSVLIDTSPDIRMQFLSNKIIDVSSVLFTHEHADQTNGLFELRPFFWKNKKKINVYGNLKTINHLIKRQDYLFKNISNYPAICKSNIVKKKFVLGKLSEKILFKTFEAKHGKTKSVVYIFNNTAYISDSNDLALIRRKELKYLNYLIIDCLKFKKHPTHFNLDEAIFIHNNLKPKKTILTNLHHDLDYTLLSRMLPKNILPAYDGLKISL